MSSKCLYPLLFTLALLLLAACAPAFAPADDDTDGDLDSDEAESDEAEADDEFEGESAAETDEDNTFENGLRFLDKNGQPADMGRQGQTVSDLVIRFKEPEKVRAALNFDKNKPLFYTLDFGERIQVTFSRFNQADFEFSEVDLSISGLARTGDRQVSCYLENGSDSVDISGTFWVLPSQSGSSLINSTIEGSTEKYE